MTRAHQPLTIVVPVCQEGANLHRWWERTAPFLPPGAQVVLVYDHEDDDTLPPARALLARGAPLRLLRNEGSGPRAAILSGLRAVPAGPALVTMADLSDDPAAIGPMLDAYRAGADVVVASRYARGGRQEGGPWLKGRLARWGGRSLRRLAGFPVSDATNSFRLYDAALVHDLALDGAGGFEVAFEITLEAWRRGRRIAEVPSVWREREAGASRFRLLRWLPRYARLWARAMAIGLRRGRARTLRSMAVPACLAAFVGLSLSALRGESATYDEGPHLAAAYTSLVLGDHRLVTEQPPLGRRIAALPLAFGPEPVRLPGRTVAWHDAEHFQYGFAFLYRSGNDPDRLLLRARLAMLSWGILLLLSVYAVARERFGPGGGLVALAAATFNPNVLAHAHLVTTDVPVAALFFLAVVAFVRWLERPSAWRCAASGLLAGGAVATKLSALALGPILAAALLWHAWQARRSPAPEAAAPSAGARAVRRALGLACMAAIAWATVWGAYGFRYAASAEPGWQAALHLQYGPQGFTGAVRWLADRRLLPEAFLAGVTELRNHRAAGHWGFALGSYSQFGWWWYLPFAFLVKNPLSWLALVAAGAAAWARRPATAAPAAWGVSFALAGLGFTGIAMTSPLAMGVRHLLPVFPFAMVACGAAWRPWPARPARPPSPPAGRGPRAAVAGLCALLAIECLAQSPHHLGFFNAATLAVAPRHRVLLDSNLDWGQDLARLKRYLDAHGIAEVKLAYFGAASPRHLGLAHEILPAAPVPLYAQLEPEWRTARGLAPGDYVAVSAFCLDKLVEGRDWISGARPVATVGASIFLFHVPERPAP